MENHVQKKKALKPRKKICNRCGHENAANAQDCTSCNSSKFAPHWIIAKRAINRQVGVEITASNPKYGDVQNRITLSKWWPGGNASFHIPNVVQWQAIETIINEQLGPLLQWKTKTALVHSLREKKETGKKVTNDIKKLVSEYPDIIKQLIKAIDTTNLGKQDLDSLIGVMGNLAAAMSGVDASFRQAFLAVVKKLPSQRKRALEDLEILLSRWSLHQITTVAHQVKSRIDTIELFKERVQDERTHEIIGDGSIHRILEGSMWLVDERYWILQSNKTLRSFIGQELAMQDKKRFGKKRPDFVCGMVAEKLIIIEIKRPSHVLAIGDLNQLETYVTLAEQYKKYSSCEGYLIGNKKDDDLQRRLKYRSSNFKVWTYSDLIDSTEARYRNYLKGIESQE